MWFSERSIRAREFGLESLGVGRQLLAARSWPRRKRTLPSFAVVYIAAGALQFESQYTKERPVRAGDAFFLFPGVWHSYGSTARSSEHYWFLFEGAAADRWCDRGMLDPARPVIRLEARRDLRTRWKQCMALAERRPPRYASVITSIMTGILAEMLLLGTAGSSASQEQSAITAVIRAMNAHLDGTSFDLAAFCERSSLSYEYLRKLFPRMSGMPPSAYFKMLKMDSARKRLAGGTDTIASIAASLGFDDPFYFSRWFKKFEKVSPLQYRASFGDFYGRPGKAVNK